MKHLFTTVKKLDNNAILLHIYFPTYCIIVCSLYINHPVDDFVSYCIANDLVKEFYGLAIIYTIFSGVTAGRQGGKLPRAPNTLGTPLTVLYIIL